MPMRLIVNAVSARAGGGLNDLLHTLPRLARFLGSGWTVQAHVSRDAQDALSRMPCTHCRILVENTRHPLRRAAWELLQLPRIVEQLQSAVVLQFSNFVPADMSVPQVVVLRSPTYFSEEIANLPRRGIYQDLRFRIGRALSRRTVENAAAVICLSETHRRDIISTCGEAGSRVVVSRPGISKPPCADKLLHTNRGELINMLPDPLRSRLHPLARSSRRVILNIAHYYTHKNLGTLLRAVRMLRERDADLSLILTAGILDYRGPATAQTRDDQRQARLLAEAGVLFDLGPVPRDCVWPLLAMCDVFAFPSSLESFGHPLLEAMAMSRPVVASDTPIHREVCDAAAVYHSVYDPVELATALEQVCDSPALRARLVEAGSRNIGRFCWDQHVRTLADAIRSAGGERR